MMDDETVQITIRNRTDSILVKKHTLNGSSSVFRKLTNDLGLSQLEIEDFDPEIVIIFLKALEEKNLKQILDSQFRELHKLTTVFDVLWLTGQ